MYIPVRDFEKCRCHPFVIMFYVLVIYKTKWWSDNVLLLVLKSAHSIRGVLE